MAPKIIGKSTRVVETDGLTIDEYAGNVGSNEDTMSLAVVKVSKPSSEPWLTLDYDEWLGIVKGKIEFHFVEDSTGRESKIVAEAGETVYVAKGERFRPVFPESDTEYIPVCIPAFKPERCLREEEDGVNTSAVAMRLSELHRSSNPHASATTEETKPSSTSQPKMLYHMCEKGLWESAVASGRAYFPPTFEQDGRFTHATAVPVRLLETANHFYTSSKGSWVCLQLDSQALKDVCGIVTTFEEPKPVGHQDVQMEWREAQWECPHIYGGIPTSVPGIVANMFDMARDDNGKF
ncbi:MAG: hypothetical protein SGARI_004665, partial [Bacillariaceae sp.]